ncbi:MAG: pyridoxal-dependent decarboxylase [Candidatus Nanopelagicales bacterium]
MAEPGVEPYRAALDCARTHADAWLASLPDRPIPPRVSADDVLKALGESLPEQGADPADVIDLLAAAAEPGLLGGSSGRFFGWVIGGTLPAALAADWLTSSWDQNAGMRHATPAAVAIEECAAAWLLDLLGLPPDSGVGFVTGATMANFTGLAAGRQHVLTEAGWDLGREGLAGGPKVRILVGAERHDTVDLALRFLGLGAPQAVAVDGQGRIRVDALAEALSEANGPTIVCLQAGNLHSGAFDNIAGATEVAHRHGAWVHVDGAFGLWAAASPALRHLLQGYEEADSWATDAHKTLNTPYDCGICVVRRPAPLYAAMGVHASYLINSDDRDPLERVPELSRRARGIPVWAALRSLGRTGVAHLVDGMVAAAHGIATGIEGVNGAEVLNEVAYTQVCLTFGDDERTRQVTERLLADGTVWMSGSHWHHRDVLRISVSNWRTNPDVVAIAVEALRRASAQAWERR